MEYTTVFSMKIFSINRKESKKYKLHINYYIIHLFLLKTYKLWVLTQEKEE